MTDRSMTLRFAATGCIRWLNTELVQTYPSRDDNFVPKDKYVYGDMARKREHREGGF